MSATLEQAQARLASKSEAFLLSFGVAEGWRGVIGLGCGRISRYSLSLGLIKGNWVSARSKCTMNAGAGRLTLRKRKTLEKGRQSFQAGVS